MTLRTFLVESYVPKLDLAAATGIAARLSDAAAELRLQGVEVRWQQSLALVGEETCLCVLTAGDAEDVRRASALAGVAPDHVVEVLQLGVNPGSGLRR